MAEVREVRRRRLIQERDRLGLWLVGTNRVLRESSLMRVLFPGRDPSTSRNRIAELAKDEPPVGAYWSVHRRTLDDGSVERYLSLNDLGYQQAAQVGGATFFERRPVEPLKPSHIEHDLELADFALSLLPTRIERHQPTVRGKPVGLAVEVKAILVPRRWRWRHASVFRRLTAFEGPKDPAGNWRGRPKIACAFEPDAILETDTWNCTRYFIEWDRGTEPIKGRETRTIQDKIRRILKYLWLPQRELEPGPHWSERSSYYLRAFSGRDRLRPKVLLVTRSDVRAANMERLAVQMFRSQGKEVQSLLEILTVEQAREKLERVLRLVEGSPEPDEMPWVIELRNRDAAAASDAARRVRAARLAELKDPSYVPRAPHSDGVRLPERFELAVVDARTLVACADELGASLQLPGQRTPMGPHSLIEVLRSRLRLPLGERLGAALGFAEPRPESFVVTLGEARGLLVDFDKAISRVRVDGALRSAAAVAALRVLGRLLVHVQPGHLPDVVAAARAAWGDDPDSPWAGVAREIEAQEADEAP